jgi:hypothetical protein
MSDKTQHKVSGKPIVAADSTTFPINITFQDHKSGSTSLAWVAAFGAAIGGVGTFWGAVKPQPAKPDPDPVVDHIRKDQGLKTIDVASVVREFSASPKMREEFVYGFQESVEEPAVRDATDGEKAISTLLDPDAGSGLRIVAALYLGGQGKREYISPLKVVSSENNVVGSAAKLAIAMLQEHLAHPPAVSLPKAPDFSRRVPRTLDPGPPKK